MAEEKKSGNKDNQSSNSSSSANTNTNALDSKPVATSGGGGIMFFGLRFLIFFGISFFLLSLPYNKRPIFYYLHQGTSKVILSLTGTNSYKPTFPISLEKIQDNFDKTKTQLAAPVK